MNQSLLLLLANWSPESALWELSRKSVSQQAWNWKVTFTVPQHPWKWTVLQHPHQILLFTSTGQIFATSDVYRHPPQLSNRNVKTEMNQKAVCFGKSPAYVRSAGAAQVAPSSVGEREESVSWELHLASPAASSAFGGQKLWMPRAFPHIFLVVPIIQTKLGGIDKHSFLPN